MRWPGTTGQSSASWAGDPCERHEPGTTIRDQSMRLSDGRGSGYSKRNLVASVGYDIQAITLLGVRHRALAYALASAA